MIYPLLITGIVLLLFFYFQQTARSEWLQGFKHRYPLEVVERSGLPLRDHQVRIHLSSTFFDFSKVKEDGSDIRFTDSNGNLLSFWIEKWPDSKDASALKEASIWVKIPEIKPYEKKLIYMYYGNENAVSYSNILNTMDFIEVAKADVSTTPTNIPFISNPELVIASPPLIENGRPLSVYTYKEGENFKAEVKTSSFDNSTSPKATVWFLGLKKGRFGYGNLAIEGTLDLVDAISSPISEKSFNTFLFSGNKKAKSIYLASLNDKPSEDAQMRLLQPLFLASTFYGSSLYLAMESDNTTSTGLQVKTATIKIEGNTTNEPFYEASKGSYVYISFENTPLENPETSLPDSEAIFASIISTEIISAFPVIKETSEGKRLVILSDTGSPVIQPIKGSLEILAFKKTGIFPVAKKAVVEPEVRFSKIKGKVFEDENLNLSFDQNEKVFKGVRVRLYEDVDNSGTINSGDVFVAETQTDADGTYALPALENKNYLIAVDAASIAGSLNIEPLPYPEEFFSVSYSDGKKVALLKPGGEDPRVSDYWSPDTDPSFNIYEHTTRIKLDSTEIVEGIDFGFSFSLVVNTLDTSLPCQGSLRQAIYNSNVLKGRQKIRFFLSEKSGNYHEVLDEFQIDLSAELPDITDSVEIDGKNINEEMASSKLIIRGSEKNIKNCFNVLSPMTSISNLKISGFENGVVFSIPQYERVLQEESIPESSFLVDSALSDSITAVFEKDLSRASLFKNGDLLSTTSSVFVDSSGEKFRILERKQLSSTNKTPEFEDFAYKGFTSLSSQGILLTGSGENRVSLGNSIFTLDPYCSIVLDIANEGSSIFTLKNNACVFSEKGSSASPLKFASERFLIPFFKGTTIEFFPLNENQSIDLKFYYGREISESTTSLAPSKITAEEDGVVLATSPSKFLALISGSSGYTPAVKPNTKLFGVFKDSLYICSEEVSFITVNATTASGRSFTIRKVIEPGIVYDLAQDESELQRSDEIKAAMIVSSSPVTALGLIKEEEESLVPFLSESQLFSKVASSLDNSKIVVAAFSGTSFNINFLDSSSSLDLNGTLFQPCIAVLESSGSCFDAVSDKPIYLLAKESLTKRYYLPLDLRDGFSDSTSTVSSTRYPFDANCLVSDTSFLACNTAIWIKEGTGIEAFRNRYVNCGEKIELGKEGKEPIDDAISIDEPNLGVDRPIINLAVYSEPTVTISGFIGSTESATFDEGRVEIYLADKSGQPFAYLGETTVTNGIFEFSQPMTAYKLKASDFAIAVFTFKDGSSSEFSDPQRIDPAPVISDVKATHITPVTIGATETLTTTITWYTDVPSTSKVVYDVVSHSSTETYAFETTETTELVTTHTVVIQNLMPNTLYYFRVISANEYGDISTSYEYMIPPGRTIPDTDLCAACHRAHTSVMKPLRLPYYVRP